MDDELDDDHYHYDEDVFDAHERAITREPEYHHVTLDVVTDMMNRVVQETAGLMGMSSDDARIVLQAFDWNAEKLKDAWFANEADVRKKAGVLVRAPTPEPSTFYCAVTMEELPAAAGVAPPCGHMFASAAWDAYCDTVLTDEPAKALTLSCMSDDCNERLRRAFVLARLRTEDRIAKYVQWEARAFISTQTRKFRHCPHPGCAGVVQRGSAASTLSLVTCGVDNAATIGSHNVLRSLLDEAHPCADDVATATVVVPTGGAQLPRRVAATEALPVPRAVLTAATPDAHRAAQEAYATAITLVAGRGIGHAFCFQCGIPGGHSSISCDDARAWRTTIASEESANAAWVAMHSKPCPKCRVDTERNEGCNHMTCTQCKTHWCWKCLRYPYYEVHDYPAQAWQCNTPPEVGPGTLAATQLRRLGFYVERNQDHEMCVRIALAARPRLAAALRAVQAATGASDAELRFVDDACDTVLTGRLTCAWSYVHAYFQSNHAESTTPIAGTQASAQHTLFREFQAAVEGYVEMLSNEVRPAILVGLLAPAPSELGKRKTDTATTSREHALALHARTAQMRLTDYRLRVTQLTKCVQNALASLAMGSDVTRCHLTEKGGDKFLQPPTMLRSRTSTAIMLQERGDPSNNSGGPSNSSGPNGASGATPVEHIECQLRGVLRVVLVKESVGVQIDSYKHVLAVAHDAVTGAPIDARALIEGLPLPKHVRDELAIDYVYTTPDEKTSFLWFDCDTSPFPCPVPLNRRARPPVYMAFVVCSEAPLEAGRLTAEEVDLLSARDLLQVAGGASELYTYFLRHHGGVVPSDLLSSIQREMAQAGATRIARPAAEPRVALTRAARKAVKPAEPTNDGLGELLLRQRAKRFNALFAASPLAGASKSHGLTRRREARRMTLADLPPQRRYSAQRARSEAPSRFMTVGNLPPVTTQRNKPPRTPARVHSRRFMSFADMNDVTPAVEPFPGSGHVLGQSKKTRRLSPRALRAARLKHLATGMSVGTSAAAPASPPPAVAVSVSDSHFPGIGYALSQSRKKKPASRAALSAARTRHFDALLDAPAVSASSSPISNRAPIFTFRPQRRPINASVSLSASESRHRSRSRRRQSSTSATRVPAVSASASAPASASVPISQRTRSHQAVSSSRRR